jgi:hypothetical protein
MLLGVFLLSGGVWRSRLFLHYSVGNDYWRRFGMAILPLSYKGGRESILYDASQACVDGLVVSRHGNCSWRMWWQWTKGGRGGHLGR